MSTKMMQVHIAVLLLCFQATLLTAAKRDQVRLEDVKVLTLHHGQWTKSRRTSAVPQLKCVGGTAGCSSFIPQTVQCYNRGSDGDDIQWECKTDMDNSYRFGKLQVSCEGYEYPDDPYILAGSCGLEYTLDLTQEGYQQKNAGGHHYGDGYHDRSGYQQGYTKKASSVFQDLIYLGIMAGVVYIIYKTCIASNNTPPQPDAPPPYDDTFRQHGNQQPPPYGFRQDHMPNNGGGSCSSGAGYTNTNTFTPPGSNTQGGFWTGAMSGGVLGYLFGRNNSYTNTHYHQPGWGARRGWGSGWGTGWGSGWGNNWGTGGGWGGSRTYTSSSGSGFSSAPRSSGTRTASGFAGTSRR